MKCRRPSAKQRVYPQHILQRTTREKELLFEPKLLADIDVVIWIENLRDVLGRHLVKYCAVIIPMIERSKIERFDGFGFPQAQDVAGVNAITRDRRVVGHSSH